MMTTGVSFGQWNGCGVGTMGRVVGERPGAIFSQPWWLEAVAPGAWGEVTVEKGGGLFARLPYTIKKHRGLTLLTMPPLTQTLGPWLRPYPGKYTNQLSEERELMSALIRQLPEFDFFRQNFHYAVTNWLPFHWHGFDQTTRYTYVIEQLNDVDAVWKETRQNIRTDVRKAEGILRIRDDLGLEAFLDLNEMTFKRQGLSLPYSHELAARVDEACKARGCRKIFFAEDVEGRLHAAVYIVWDEESAYYLMGGSDPRLRNSGATSLAMWEAIQFAASVTQSFDFEGSMIEPVERFFRAFGAKQKRYFQVSKINSLLLKMRQDVRSWLELWREQ